MTDDPILAMEEELRRAQLAGDAAALDRLIDDELVFTGTDGRVYTKADDLALHLSGRLRIARMDPGERPAPVHPRLVRAPGGWRVVAGHTSAVRG